MSNIITHIYFERIQIKQAMSQTDNRQKLTKYPSPPPFKTLAKPLCLNFWTMLVLTVVRNGLSRTNKAGSDFPWKTRLFPMALHGGGWKTNHSHYYAIQSVLILVKVSINGLENVFTGTQYTRSPEYLSKNSVTANKWEKWNKNEHIEVHLNKTLQNQKTYFIYVM